MFVAARVPSHDPGRAGDCWLHGSLLGVPGLLAVLLLRPGDDPTLSAMEHLLRNSFREPGALVHLCLSDAMTGITKELLA